MTQVFRTDRLVLAGNFSSGFEDKKARFRYALQMIYKQQTTKNFLDLPNNNFKQKLDKLIKKHEVFCKNKQVHLSRSRTQKQWRKEPKAV